MPPMNNGPMQGLTNAAPQPDAPNPAQSPDGLGQAANEVLQQAVQQFGPEIIGAILQLLTGPGEEANEPAAPQMGGM